MIAIGAYSEDGKIYYYAIVRGKASRRSYEGHLGLVKALAEAHEEELFLLNLEYLDQLDFFHEILIQKEFENSIMELANIYEDYGIAIVFVRGKKPFFTYTDTNRKLHLKQNRLDVDDDKKFNNAAEVLEALKFGSGPRM